MLPFVRIDGEEHVFHYLESLDSVSARWVGQRDHDSSADRSKMRRAQIFLDVLMTLAFGRDVVVPQSYAFDSGGFLEVAETVLKAKKSASAANDHPFRLHLYGVDSFDQALNNMLSRVNNKDRPFHSSLFPRLNEAPRQGLRIPATFDELRQSGLIDNDIGNALELVRGEFSSLSKVPAHPPSRPFGIPELLVNFVNGDSPVARMIELSTDEITRSVHFDLLFSIQELDPSRPEPFQQRSQLRVEEPWPNDELHRMPKDIVGAPNLQLVIEFVDTLYNAVVARSIGVAPVTYTTDIAIGNESLSRRGIAQELALILCGIRTPDSYSPIQGAVADPLFEMRADRVQALSNQHINALIKRLADGTAEKGLAALLDQRAARGGRTGGRRSDFWTSLDRLYSAIDDSDARLARRSLERHLVLVERLLGHGTKLTLGAGFRVVLSVLAGAVGTAAPGYAIARWPFMTPDEIALVLGAGGAAAAAGGALAASLPTVSISMPTVGRHRLSQALGEVINVAVRS